MAESEKAEGKIKKVFRREFLVGSGAALAAGALSVSVPGPALASEATSDGKVSYAASTGYVVYDSRLCWGCQSCMLLVR
jgi:hypothetical protein